MGEEGGLKVLDGLPIGRCGPSGRRWQPPPWIQLSSENSTDKFISSCLPLTWARSTIGMIKRHIATKSTTWGETNVKSLQDRLRS